MSTSNNKTWHPTVNWKVVGGTIPGKVARSFITFSCNNHDARYPTCALLWDLVRRASRARVA